MNHLFPDRYCGSRYRSIEQRLIQLLADLDECSEPVAAVHVNNALEVIRDRALRG